MKSLIRCWPVLLALIQAAHAAPFGAIGPGSGVVLDWNEQIIATAVAEDGLLTLKGVRTAAMMHIAMHDALNSIDSRYETYEFKRKVNANPLAAATQAAFEVAVAQYPNKKPEFDRLLKRHLQSTPDASLKTNAVALGKATAAAVLKRRADDGWNRETQYKWLPMGPGVYAEFHEHSDTPVGFVFGAGWSQVKPFVLSSSSQFRSAPPPSIASAEYTRAFNEVKELGAYESAERTPEQTHIAFWWKDFVENSHNRLARSLVKERNTDLWTAARLFALLNVSIIDGYIASFDGKFFYNHWRPFTAIRWAANDGNPDTAPDANWNNTHKHTYAFPSYPSAHGTVCAAAMTIMADAFGETTGFTMETTEVDASGPLSEKIRMNPTTRSFKSFSEAAMQCAMSRVYLGIHFRYDSEAGNELGRRIGQFALQSAMNRKKAVIEK